MRVRLDWARKLVRWYFANANRAEGLLLITMFASLVGGVALLIAFPKTLWPGGAAALLGAIAIAVITALPGPNLSLKSFAGVDYRTNIYWGLLHGDTPQPPAMAYSKVADIAIRHVEATCNNVIRGFRWSTLRDLADYVQDLALAVVKPGKHTPGTLLYLLILAFFGAVLSLVAFLIVSSGWGAPVIAFDFALAGTVGWFWATTASIRSAEQARFKRRTQRELDERLWRGAESPKALERLMSLESENRKQQDEIRRLESLRVEVNEQIDKADTVDEFVAQMEVMFDRYEHKSRRWDMRIALPVTVILSVALTEFLSDPLRKLAEHIFGR